MKLNYLTRDPLGTLDRSKVDRPLKPTFSIAELRKLLAREHESDPYFLRFALLAYTRCRVGEAMHLRWENLDWDGHRIAVVLDGAYSLKGRKKRAVPLQRELADLLNPIAKPAGWIIEDHNDRERAQTYGWHFKAFLKRCGIETGERSPHSTRHT